MKLGVLISGRGSNLDAILRAIDEGRLAAEVAIVVSNKADAGGLERAAKAGVATRVIDHKAFGSREDFDAAMVAVLREAGASVVVLAGFMRIITRVLLDAFPMRVVNIHPSILPAFPGVDAQAQALAYGARASGCTVHFVDAGTDTGPILAQAIVPVFADDTRDSLAARILVQEHALLVRALGWLAEDRVTVETTTGRPRVTVRDRATVFFDRLDEASAAEAK
jgi:phosphoribosylglycinamide formyltransferase-1